MQLHDKLIELFDYCCIIGDGSRFFLSHCCKRYCFKGYFWVVIAALCFFVVFPAGIFIAASY